MLNTDKLTCRLVAEALVGYGCQMVVLSPGTRNAPIIMALNRQKGLTLTPVIDEREAAFVALGMAVVSGKPVGVVCTSGTAMLNYGPAIAEAYYRHIPLIAITADRPSAWIDQDDSQTIRQSGALANVVLGTVNLRGECPSEDDRWVANRKLNEALQQATSGRRGPVHVNISLSEPLTHETEIAEEGEFHKIDLLGPEGAISVADARNLASALGNRKVLIVGGFYPPNALLSKALLGLASLPNVAMVAEGLANLHGDEAVTSPDVALQAISTDKRRAFAPDLLITFGGSIVSRNLKEFLRSAKIKEHWHVGRNNSLIDTYRQLSLRVEIAPENFFPRLAGAAGHYFHTKPNMFKGEYANQWRQAYQAGRERLRELKEYSDLWATGFLLENFPAPSAVNLQLGNGTAVRLALLRNLRGFHRVDSNRGVSGIDGCLSTAIGAASAYNKTTLLLIGDMSLSYDVGALALAARTPRLKIAVLSNGGGNIFRFISTTRSLPERETFMCCPTLLPLKQLCDAYGITYVRASNKEELERAIELLALTEGAALLEIVTDGEKSAEQMRQFYSSKPKQS